MGNATRALAGAAAIGAVSLLLGAAHSMLVPIRLTAKKPAPSAGVTDVVPDTDPVEPADPTDVVPDPGADQTAETTPNTNPPTPIPTLEADSDYTYIELARAKQIWDARWDELVVFIDARPRDLYEAGHIADAYWLPTDQITANAVFTLQDLLGGTDGTIVIYCVGGDCDASEHAAIRLHDGGFTNILIMRAGYDDWVNAGYDTYDGPPDMELNP